MSSTSLKIENLNQIIKENHKILEIINNYTYQYLLHIIRKAPGISINNLEKNFIFEGGTPKEWLNGLVDTGFIKDKNGKFFLTDQAENLFCLKDTSLEDLGNMEIPGKEMVQNKLPDSYLLDKQPLGKGATSVTYKAIQKSTGMSRTVKIFRPGVIDYDGLMDFRKKRMKISKDIAIPDFIGMGQFKIKMKGKKKPVILSCQVFELINGNAQTLQEYVNLSPQPFLTRDFFKLFVEHVGGALEAIEKAGLYHGDLHSGNILVVKHDGKNPNISFKVIDLAGASNFNSLKFSGVTDLEMFKRHLLWCLSETCRLRPGVSARELIGYQVERIIIGLRQNKYSNFTELLKDFNKPSTTLPSNYFHEPPKQPFEWLRVEMMPSLEHLYLLFKPDGFVYKALSGSDNVIISGPRGCGKSHYLRSLTFSPKILKIAKENTEIRNKLEKIGYDYQKFFGILFECRVGEFKNFTPESCEGSIFSAEIIKNLKHILILKIINKTLSAIRDGCENEILISPENIYSFRNFIQKRFQNIPIYGETDALQEMIQYAHALVTKEKQDELTWSLNNIKTEFLLSEPDLNDFFKSLQQDFIDLSNSQFFILVDDASEGRMHPEMQKILNSIMTSATKRFCFKVTCDKAMYTLETIEGRAIDPSQDFIFVDLASLSVKAERSGKEITKYIKDIVNIRLNSVVKKNMDITHILGKSQNPREFLTLLANTKLVAKKEQDILENKKRALYGGWNIVLQLSHGSIRTLFQLLNYIFLNSNFDYNNPKEIPLIEQDEYVREFSKQKFKSLLMLKGEIDGDPLGTPLSNFANSIGEVSREYLTKWNTGEKGRFYETISIEKTDLRPLSKKADRILKYLVVYDILITEGMNFSRAQFGISQRFDLNKIYAPCFQTTYRVRNHLYLSKNRFEELLLQPEIFVKKTREKLGLYIRPETQVQKKLFDEE